MEWRTTVVACLNGPYYSVFDRQHRTVDIAIDQCGGDFEKLPGGHRLRITAPELLDRFFTEGAKFTLKGNAEWCGH